MKCPSCRADIPEGKRFCMDCGAPLPQSCSACGNLNPPTARYCGDCGARLEGGPVGMILPAGSREVEPAVAAPSAERRPLTVMFCDLVGSTALSARLDPEDLRDVIAAYHGCVAETVGRFEGFVARYMGDGALIYFGYPRAHEDDAERAVRAGLALVGAVRRLGTRVDALEVRVGIATGLAVVGDLIGSGAAQEHGVIGETPNLAARLQAVAEPGGVMVDPTTRRLTGSLFECVDLGLVALNGLPSPVRIARVLGERRVESRFEALRSAALTPLVGREEETALLRRRWRQARDGNGHAVLVSGEPGIGKSRLAAVLQESVDGEPHVRLRCFCSPQHADSALYPVIAQLETAAGFERDDAPDRKRAKLEAWLAAARPCAEDLALLAELLGLPAGETSPVRAASPQRRKELTLAALLHQIEGLARQCPVLMVWEDVHWIDPTSRELLDLLVERVEAVPALLVVTFRPEFVPPWTGRAHVTLLQLARLSRRQNTALVARVAGDALLRSELLDQLVTRSDGIPLFAEELTKAVLESGLAKEANRNAAAALRPPFSVPTTLQASLMARLDRLGPAREVAQVGAAIGRDFSYELVAAVAGLSEPALRNALSRLAEAELVFVRGRPPEAVYSFKHALVQDAAYGSLLRDRRRQLHRTIAEALEARGPEAASARPELLARHWAEGGFPERAVPLWLEAGRLAAARSTLKEAAAHLGRGLELLASLPEERSRDRMELEFQITLGSTLINLRGYAAAETGRAFARAQELCLCLGDVERLFPVLFGHCLVHLLRGGTRELELAEEFLRLAESAGDAESKAVAHRAMGITLFHMGRVTEGCGHFERALVRLDEVRAPASPPTRYPFDSRAATLGHNAIALGVRGRLDRARAQSRAALDHVRRLGHVASLAQGLWLAIIVQQLCRNVDAVAALAEELVRLGSEQGFPMWLGYGHASRGWALGERGRATDGIAAIFEGIDLFRSVGAGRFLAQFHLLAAQVQTRAGRGAEALELAGEGLRLAAAHHDHWTTADLHRCRGDALRLVGPADGAEAAFAEAIRFAREQDARLWELRASLSLARLRLAQGRPAEAHRVLAPIYGSFTEGFDTPDLQDAAALLDGIRE